MGRRFLIIAGVIAICAIAAIVIGRANESAKRERQVALLTQSASSQVGKVIDFDSFADLPKPVARYLKLALTDGQKCIKAVEMRQTGTLRTSVATEKWSSFTASQLVVPPATGFIWNARVKLPLALHVRVLDSYIAGIGSGSVSLLSALTVDAEADVHELNSGALHRYLAEAVWYPTALVPGSGVVWSAINEHSALATLTDKETTVSLEFQFNEAGEVKGIFSPGRFSRVDGRYERKAWEGHFRDYQLQDGMLVPQYGEVGWYEDRGLELVWKGNLIDARYELDQ